MYPSSTTTDLQLTAPVITAADVYAFQRCRYPSKFCPNVRCRKRNGQLHRFCEVHRARANKNQKKWSTSRRDQWWQAQYPHIHGAHPYHHPAHGDHGFVDSSMPFDDTLEAMFVEPNGCVFEAGAMAPVVSWVDALATAVAGSKQERPGPPLRADSFLQHPLLSTDAQVAWEASTISL